MIYQAGAEVCQDQVHVGFPAGPELSVLVEGKISSDLYRVSGCDIETRHFPLTCKTKEKFYPILLYTKPLTKSVWVNLPEFVLVL